MVRPYSTEEQIDSEEENEHTVNNITLLGRVGKTPTPDPKNLYLNFGVVTDRFTPDGFKVVDWSNVNINCMNETVVSRNAKELRKGDRVFIQGFVRNRDHVKDGVQRKYTNVVPSFIMKVPQHVTQVELKSISSQDAWADMENEALLEETH